MGGGVLPVLLVVWMGGGGVAAGGTRGTGTGTGTTSTSGALYEMLDMCVAGFAGLLHVRAEVKTLDLQTFSSALAGIACEPITTTDDVRRPYAVGSDTFTDYASAAVRTCNNQKNKCAEVANQGGGGSPVTLEDCNEQEGECHFFAFLLALMAFSRSCLWERGWRVEGWDGYARRTDGKAKKMKRKKERGKGSAAARGVMGRREPEGEKKKCTSNAVTTDPSTIGVAPPPQATPAPPSRSFVEEASPISPPPSSPPAADPPTVDSPTADSPAADPPAAERPSGNSPAAERPSGNSPAADPPAAHSPAADLLLPTLLLTILLLPTLLLTTLLLTTLLLPTHLLPSFLPLRTGWRAQSC
ncbi:putative Neurofilament medium polypeptide [Drepanopeziza brunnea f. sp. 'multigermtubi' MB_m1]|uniref:Putative Neurofilament medium polypeptide n=1 Tax=Marssonina brunnea f. sp. multigermtubi (strain MB_m1) TaxID=1072389 RepID=K1X841_MARBU|nr:putative Neurofilament medium polypeptide [Drepanopeziza brunnea f. sp. 'multigermtubi' MB_m1]EKD16833.1 putative Neurofilament medium polypeptide [Drepanopeziza brunnea f. sp. 'multigermtubi' MB_m1]